MSEPIRIGAVSYLNTKPLICDLEHLAPEAELILEPPSRLADQNTAINVIGFSGDGLRGGFGCSCVNVNNAWQLYSFHPAGVNTVRGDGSVQFLQENVDPGTLAALITRAGGEIVSDE